jgi:hypothetical protein
MDMKTKSLSRRLWAILALAALLFTACPTGSDDGPPATEEPTSIGGIINITYSAWTLQSDGRRRSPSISDNGITKARISFTSTETNAFITIQLDVSSEAGYDFAFISTLDNGNATASRGYYTGSRISGISSVPVTIPVPTAGNHFIDVGYHKDSSDSGGSDCAWFKITHYSVTEPSSVRYSVTFTAGTGTGTAPASQTVSSGTVITLPEQGAMIAPQGTVFAGWKTGDQTYAAKASFTVTANTTFVAQWGSALDPNKTYVRFNNLEQFPVIIYADPSRQEELARAPASGTGTAIEAGPKPQGIAVYPRFLLTIEGIPITYDAPALTMRVNEKQVNTISIPALTSLETAFAYIKIANASAYSLTLNKGNSELSPLEATSNIVMPAETAAYQVEPGAASLYSFMQNTNTPLSFPAAVQQFNRGVIYTFTYTGSALTLSSSNSILQSILPKAPASLTAETVSWNSVELSWDQVYGATSYKVYRAKGSGSPEACGDVSGTSYTDTGLSPHTTYTYQVKVVSNKSGEGPASTGVSATTEELRSPVTVRSATEMNQVLALFNNDEYGECTLVLADSFSLDAVALSRSSGSAVLAITSEGADKTLSLSSLSIGSGVSLVLEEATLEGLDKGDWLVKIGSNGAFTMKAGSKVHGNSGGGVYLNGGTFALEGGAISGNSRSSSSGSSYGGGVYLKSGTFIMSGGAISGNSLSTTSSTSTSASRGGGVYMEGGTFTMSNGTISGNSASASYANSYASCGGGVFVEGGTFTLIGGTISGNSVSCSASRSTFGGGVNINDGGTFTMSGGAISGNSLSSPTDTYGGGVYVQNATFTKQSGGIIYGSDGGSLQNSANYGKAVYGYNSSSNTTYKRNTTAGNGVTLNSNTSGNAGGWE